MLNFRLIFEFDLNFQFLDDYEAAVEYKKTHRGKTPPLYNPARVREKPIPIVQQPGTSSILLVQQPGNNSITMIQQPGTSSSISETNNDRQATALNQNENSSSDGDTFIEPLLVEIQGQVNCNGNDELNSNQFNTSSDNIDENDSSISTFGTRETVDPLAVKAEAINNHSIDEDEELNSLATARIEVVDDDMVITYDTIAHFKPIQSQLQMKRSDDFSDSIPYQEDVSIFFSF